MVKTIHFKVTDDEYYRLLEIKAKYKKNTWLELIEQLVGTNNPNVFERHIH